MKSDPELRTLYGKVRREKSAKQSYINESSSHFKVVFDGYEHGGISRKVIGILEDAYKFILSFVICPVRASTFILIKNMGSVPLRLLAL